MKFISTPSFSLTLIRVYLNKCPRGGIRAIVSGTVEKSLELFHLPCWSPLCHSLSPYER